MEKLNQKEDSRRREERLSRAVTKEERRAARVTGNSSNIAVLRSPMDATDRPITISGRCRWLRDTGLQARNGSRGRSGCESRRIEAVS